ncbi:polynucleotide adenylyltransferase PcnB [Marinospirillum sp.]|uniref:polynucleotide adenylyltransferase PcnB n=1 Tax=Marinospirillum sp. TaxID=2183934 RepID=UPI002870A69C|nr:polynucleotide adenylyltransferase PcnB [Marinospirillum sp.]MDR9467400.1 polynucleotide adenylyltransferase PcnB [Marinospirillum sp.]
MLKGFTRYISNKLNRKAEPRLSQKRTLSRAEHPISRSEIHEGALKVLYRLHKSGHQAYLVGGCIRDRLLGKNPKDFDVATDATPEEVNQLFRNSRIIGRRFRIVHVRFGRDIIEVTTFRGQAKTENTAHHRQSDEGMLLRDNVWGSIEEDAARRDFTINALYYNIADFSVYDFTGGLEDIKNRRLRLIGDPETRYREDPVRMLRAIRFMAKLDFELEEQTAAPIREHAELLLQVAPARLFDEVLKLFLSGQALKTFHLLQEYHLFGMLFPASYEAFKVNPTSLRLVEQALANTDQRIHEDRPVAPAFLYAALLWPGLLQINEDLLKRGTPPFPAMQQAGNRLLQRQNQHITIPKRFAFPMREIWDLQLKLPKRQGKQAWRLLQEPRFRAAYDFLLLRETAGEATEGLAAWWTEFQRSDQAGQQQLQSQLGRPKKPRGRRRSRKTPQTPS